jgi:energy-coupling factor transporter transmembrane protein EcfT
MAIEFQKGDSLLHILDARTKLLIFIGATLLAVIIVDPILMAAIFGLLYYLGTRAIDTKLLNKNLRVLVVIFLTFSLFQIFFFTPDDSYFLFYLIPFKQLVPVTVQGIIRGVAVFFRFFSVVLAVHLMLYTTPPVDLALTITKREQQFQLRTDLFVSLLLSVIFFIIGMMEFNQEIKSIALSPFFQYLTAFMISLILSYLVVRIASHGLPPEMGVALTLGFATVGILSKQTQKITDAQKARGYDVQPKNLIKRVQVLTALLLPIFVATMERSQDIAIAILSRGFDYNINKRTYRRQLVFQKIDYTLMAIMIIMIIGSISLNYLEVGNLTEQFILNLISS